MSGTIAPFPKHVFLTNAGLPAVGYQLFTYVAGTTTKLATYTDYALSSSNTNPIILDAAGRATIFLSNTLYKFVLAPPTDTDPPVSPVWTVDYVSSVPLSAGNIDVEGAAGETITAGQFVYLSDGSGGLNAGQWYLTDSDNTYSSRTANAVGIALEDMTAGIILQTGKIRIAGRYTGYSSSLTIGAPYYLSATPGAITSSASDATRIVAVADSATSLIISQWPIFPPATSALSGVLTTTAQAITGVKTFGSMPLITNGAISSPVPCLLFSDGAEYKAATPANNTATGWSASIQGGTLKKNGDALRVTIGYKRYGAGANPAELKLDFGATPLTVVWRASTTTVVAGGTFEVMITRRSATSVIMTADGLTLVPDACTAYVAGTETLANNLPLLTKHGLQDATDYLAQESITVGYVPAP